MANVALRNIQKKYERNIVAVKDFNLDIADKEFVVLLGPSGCGKSTTLRMIAGLEEISDGEIFIDGKIINDVSPKDRDIAMVFQNYALYPHMTVYENLAFSLKLRHEKKDSIDRKVKAAADILNITGLLQRKPKALSGGERQRVAIGRAIVREPKVFLMDEPLSNLDAKLRNQMRTEIIKLKQRVDTTFVYVTHDQTEAMTLGDHIVVMKDGTIQQIGTPYDVFNFPANLFVAGFIGVPQMNFFDARLERINDTYSVAIQQKMLTLTSTMPEKLKRREVYSQDITLGIRAEHMQLAKINDSDAIKASVDVCEMMGSEYYLHILVEGGQAIMRMPVMDLPGRKGKGIGTASEIAVKLAPEYIHLFSKETEENLVTE